MCDICCCCKVQAIYRGLGECPPPPPGIFLNRKVRNGAVSSVSITQTSVSQERLEFTQIPFKTVVKKKIINKKIIINPPPPPQILGSKSQPWNGEQPDKTAGFPPQMKTLIIYLLFDDKACYRVFSLT